MRDIENDVPTPKVLGVFSSLINRQPSIMHALLSAVRIGLNWKSQLKYLRVLVV